MATTTRSADHFGLTVANIERAVAFYSKLGFKPMMDEPVVLSGDWVDRNTGVKDARTRVMFVQLDQFSLELIEFVGPAAAGAAKTPLRTNDVGSFHIAVEVDDMDAVYDELQADGIEFRSAPNALPEELQGQFPTLKSVWLYDPDGNTAQLVQRAKSPPRA